MSSTALHGIVVTESLGQHRGKSRETLGNVAPRWLAVALLPVAVVPATSPWGLPRPRFAAAASACPARLSPIPVQYGSAPLPMPTAPSPGKLLSSCRNAEHEPFYLHAIKQLVHEICFYRNPYRCQPSAARHGWDVNHPSLPTGEGRCAQTQPVIPAGPRAPSPSAAVGLWPSDQAQPGPTAPSPHRLSCGPGSSITEAAGLRTQAAEGL